MRVIKWLLAKVGITTGEYEGRGQKQWSLFWRAWQLSLERHKLARLSKSLELEFDLLDDMQRFNLRLALGKVAWALVLYPDVQRSNPDANDKWHHREVESTAGTAITLNTTKVQLIPIKYDHDWLDGPEAREILLQAKQAINRRLDNQISAALRGRRGLGDE